MLDTIAADDTLSAKIYSASKTAIYRLFAYVVAVAIWIHETLFDEHKAEVNEILASQKTHNLRWYAEMARAFQYGYGLVDGTDYYPEIDESAQIVSHAAVDEINGTLYMKVAKEDSGELAPLSIADPNEITPFGEYIQRIKDAGVKINIISDVGDSLRITLDVFYDPLLIDENGLLLADSSQEPAKDAIKNFIKNLPFNGEFIPASLVDALQETEGVDIPVILSCETKYALNEWQNVDGKVVPNAGYLTVADEDLTINYRANV